MPGRTTVWSARTSGRGRHGDPRPRPLREVHGCPADGDNGLGNEGGEVDGRALRRGAANARKVSVGVRP